jgi:putative transposase
MAANEGIKTHYTAKELAGLPGLPATESAVIRRAKAENWLSVKRAGRGGGREYPISALPKLTRDHLTDQMIAALPATVCALPEPTGTALALRTEAALPVVVTIDVPDLGDLKTWQTRSMDARLAFIRIIERGDCTVGVTKTINTLVEKSAAGELPDELQRLVAVANARCGKGGKRTLSKRTLMRWWSDYKAAAGNYAALAPATVEKTAVPAWAPAFLSQYRVPQKISVPDALERMRSLVPAGTPLPSESQVRRWLKKFSRLDVERGRKSGSELRGQRLYRQRDVSEFQPLDIVQIDGHSFKAYVAHPRHGRPFHPEVCAVICTVTKAVVGWSAGLAESATTVADAIRHACTTSEDKPLGGLPLFVFADNGGGNTAKVNIDEVAGLFARLDIKFETGRPGNPQGRGLVENLNKSLWIPAAKRFETYTGRGMDSLEQRKVYLKLQKEVRTAQTEEREINSELLLRWPDFLEVCSEAVEAYNRRQHSALPRITDPATGLRRNMSPKEAWGAWLVKGWRPEMLTEAEIGHVFRPHEMVKCVRGTVRLWKNVYADASLEHYHGMMLMVGYDIHDPSRAWVRDENGRLLVIAKRDANKSSFLPVSKVEDQRESRFKNRMRNVNRRAEEIELERRGGPIELRVAPEYIEISAEVIEKTDRIAARNEQKKRLFGSPWERYSDLRDRIVAADETVTAYERRWFDDYEIYTSTRKRVGLFAEDEFCLKGDGQPPEGDNDEKAEIG